MHSDSIIPKSERRSLRYDYTAPEIYDLSMRLANKTKEIASKEAEKKSVVSQFSATINELKATVAKLSNNVSEGYEFREVECTIEFNKPEQGKKTLTRSDNKQQIIERMESWEWNLFTSVGADDDILPPPPIDKSGTKKPRRGKKQSTDILDEIEGMDTHRTKGVIPTGNFGEDPNDLPFL